jgi:hypothetical protein
MSIPTSEPLFSDDDKKMPPARRRRQQRSLLPDLKDERAAFVSQMAHQVTPGYDFFLYTMLTGALIGAAILIDSLGFYILAILFAPFLGPVLGLSLAASVGSGRFFLKAFGALVIACLIIFGLGGLTGLIATYLMPDAIFEQIGQHALLTWPDFVVLALGSGLATYMLVRSPRQKPLVANVAIAYELFLPLSVAGFALVVGNNSMWLDGLVVFSVHLILAALVGTVVLFVVGLRPAKLFGYSLAAAIVLISVVTIVAIAGLATGNQISVGSPPSVTPTLTNTVTMTETPTLTATPEPTQTTMTATNTLVPTNTPTLTVTPQPTPIWARVSSPTGGGAIIREEPDGRAISSLLNDTVLEVISEPLRGESGTIWVQVRTDTGLVGWMVQALLATATPSPGW